MVGFLNDLKHIVVRVLVGFQKDRCTRHAAALAFSSLLALAPLVAIGFSVLSVFSSLETLGHGLEEFIYQYLVPDAGLEVRQYLNDFAEKTGKLTAVGLITFFITALILLLNIEESLNDIWRSKVRRSMVQRMLIYWALVTAGPILMGASLSLSTYFLSLDMVNDLSNQADIYTVLPLFFETMAFFILYTIMPNSPIRWRYALIGAVVAAILFELTKRAFSLFIINFNNYEIVYGALATLPIFLIWIYLSWIVILLGAEVVAALHQRRLDNQTLETGMTD